jgi:hypothetical protein
MYCNVAQSNVRSEVCATEVVVLQSLVDASRSLRPSPLATVYGMDVRS